MSQKSKIVISGTGIFTPPHTITNDELVNSFNQYVDLFNKANVNNFNNAHNVHNVHHFNKENESQNESQHEPLKHSTKDFIIKASGIEKRYVLEKTGILDIERMKPKFHERQDDRISLQCEIGVKAAKEAFEQARISTNDIDLVLVACSNIERAYPAIAVEIQNELNIEGFGYDMNAGCASAVFAIQTAVESIARGNAKGALIVNPEVMTGQINFRDRDSHFIFGDAASAIILQKQEHCKNEHAFAILGTKLKTQFSNNIRNNFGFLNHCALNIIDPPHALRHDNHENHPNHEHHHNHENHQTFLSKAGSHHQPSFTQQGRKVFKEVIPFVSEVVLSHLASLNITSSQLKRLWLHQANVNMNRLIATKILNREPNNMEAPIILDEYANTSSAGTIIAFNKYHQDLKSNDIGILCAFGAGYSVGNIVLQKI